jgi:hypothetical protein
MSHDNVAKAMGGWCCLFFGFWNEVCFEVILVGFGGVV